MREVQLKIINGVIYMRLASLINEWLNYYHKDNIRSQTYLRYQCAINNYILPDKISNRPISKITARELQEYLNRVKMQKSRKTKTYLSAVNINIIITVLKAAFNYAHDFKLIKEDPSRKIKRVTNKKPNQISAFTTSEQQQIEKYIKSLNNPEYFGIILCLYTGLRIGELMALEWNDIDFEEGLMTINKTEYLSKTDDGTWQSEINTPKTRSSNRIIPIPDYILKVLKELKAKSKSQNVISRKDGSKITANLYRHRFLRMTEKLGIRSLNFHALRHTFATRALESGMDVRTLSDVMGHANASITLNIYTHSMSEHKKLMMNNIPSLVTY